MTCRQVFASLVVAVALCGQAQAQPATRPGPPEGSMKLSQIIDKIEARPQFQYIDEVDWDSDGYYEVTYYTTDKAKVEIKIDPKTGEAR